MNNKKQLIRRLDLIHYQDILNLDHQFYYFQDLIYPGRAIQHLVSIVTDPIQLVSRRILSDSIEPTELSSEPVVGFLRIPKKKHSKSLEVQRIPNTGSDVNSPTRNPTIIM